MSTIREPGPVNFPCEDCAEMLRGIEGQIAVCPVCGTMQDAPYLDDERAQEPKAQEK